MADQIKSNEFNPAVFPADILYDSNLKSSERLVLIILFTYTNAHSNTAWPSYNTIAERAGLSRRAVIDIVDSLIAKGYIVKREQFQKSNKPGSKLENTSNLYTLFFKSKTKEEGSEKSAPPLVKNLHHPSEKSAPKLSNELSNIELSNLIDDEEGGIERKKEFEGDDEKNYGQYEELAKKLGASKEDLAKCLERLDMETDIETPMAWLTVALKNQVANRKLSERPKRQRSSSNKKHSPTILDQEVKKSKYEAMYL